MSAGARSSAAGARSSTSRVARVSVLAGGKASSAVAGWRSAIGSSVTCSGSSHGSKVCFFLPLPFLLFLVTGANSASGSGSCTGSGSGVRTGSWEISFGVSADAVCSLAVSTEGSLSGQGSKLCRALPLPFFVFLPFLLTGANSASGSTASASSSAGIPGAATPLASVAVGSSTATCSSVERSSFSAGSAAGSFGTLKGCSTSLVTSWPIDSSGE